VVHLLLLLLLNDLLMWMLLPSCPDNTLCLNIARVLLLYGPYRYPLLL
jgi:hypothetical protein